MRSLSPCCRRKALRGTRGSLPALGGWRTAQDLAGTDLARIGLPSARTSSIPGLGLAAGDVWQHRD